jgi:hypothetical protein
MRDDLEATQRQGGLILLVGRLLAWVPGYGGDLSALRMLVDALGPLEVGGIDEPVTGQSVVEVVQEQSGGHAAGWDAAW